MCDDATPQDVFQLPKLSITTVAAFALGALLFRASPSKPKCICRVKHKRRAKQWWCPKHGARRAIVSASGKRRSVPRRFDLGKIATIEYKVKKEGGNESSL
jgi:hypothetical protein